MKSNATGSRIRKGEIMKNVLIMGDSYSTYQGYLPEGYHTYYSDERTSPPIVHGVENTWWRILTGEMGLNLVCNDSFSGSTVCNTVRPALSVDSSFLRRMDKYLAEGFFSENKIDLMLIFGGTNDSWIDAPVGRLQYADWTEEDLKNVLPAFCYLLSRAKPAVGEVVVLLNTGLKEEITGGFREACGHYGIRYLDLKEIDKECGHPTELGMRQIAGQVAEFLNEV